jgi:hypothetical protein
MHFHVAAKVELAFYNLFLVVRVVFDVIVIVNTNVNVNDKWRTKGAKWKLSVDYDSSIIV